jgi:DNA-binding transcriptional MocR family regulator
VEALTDLKIATAFGGAHFSAALILSLLTDGSYRKHMEALRQRLAATVPDVAARLKAIGCVPWIEPQAGMFLWCSLPEGVDAGDVARRALSQQVVLAPGNVFSSSQSASGFMRFNVSQMDGPQVMTVLTDALQRGLDRRPS